METILSGRVEQGVVVLTGGASLPEVTEVTVVVHATPRPQSDNLSEAERQSIREILDRIAALPIEGSSEPFSATDQ